MRLSAAIDVGGCPLCVVRERAERGMLDAIIAERVLDLGFRAGLERDHGFCRRHAAELLVTDRRSSGILGSSILYGAMLERRLGAIREALATRGARRRRGRLVGRRAGDPAASSVARAPRPSTSPPAASPSGWTDPDWAAAAAALPFCLDDLVAVPRRLDRASPRPARSSKPSWPVSTTCAARLEGYAYHSAQDRRQLLTDEERAAADEAARVLGGD